MCGHKEPRDGERHGKFPGIKVLGALTELGDSQGGWNMVIKVPK